MRKRIKTASKLGTLIVLLSASGCRQSTLPSVERWIDCRKNNTADSTIDRCWNEIGTQEFPDLTIVSADVERVSETCYLIHYVLSDSTGQEYKQREEVRLTKEGEIEAAYLYFEEWQRVFYYAPTIEQLLDYASDSLIARDYRKLLSVMHELPYSDSEERSIAAIEHIEYRILDEESANIKILLDCSASGSSILLTGKHEMELSVVQSGHGYFIAAMSECD